MTCQHFPNQNSLYIKSISYPRQGKPDKFTHCRDTVPSGKTLFKNSKPEDLNSFTKMLTHETVQGILQYSLCEKKAVPISRASFATNSTTLLNKVLLKRDLDEAEHMENNPLGCRSLYDWHENHFW
jgi:hypothetical protein